MPSKPSRSRSKSRSSTTTPEATPPPPAALRRWVPFDASAFQMSDAEVEQALTDERQEEALTALFGAEELRELRGLADQVRSRDTVRGTRRRVLILPGIMGSKIGRRRKLIGTDTVWIEPFDLLSGGLARLTLPTPGDGFHAIGVMLTTYLLIKLRLKAAGFDADFYPFDWRRPIADLGKELADTIAADPAREIWLVAHSMGGLVARAALTDPRTKKVRRLIQQGTPNFGSFSPVMALRGIHGLAKKLAAIDLKHSNARLTEQVFASFPGLYEMLPASERYSRQDLFDPATWPAHGIRPRSELLAQARGLPSRLAPPDDRFVLIAGVNQDTAVSARIENGEWVFEVSPAGDGTVPFEFARLDGIPIYYVDGGEHGALPRNGKVIQATIELLRDATPSELPDAPPAAITRSSSVRSLRESDLARLEPPRQRGTTLAPEDLRSLLDGFCAQDDRHAPPLVASMTVATAGSLPTTDDTLDDPATSAAPADNLAAVPERFVFGRRRQHRLDVRLVQGSITQVDTRAYVVGLLREVAPGGAAMAIDAKLGGTIREFTQRRLFSGNVGEVFILPRGRAELRAEIVLFAGLGLFDAFNAEVLRLVAENIVRTLVHTHVEEFATVLVGSGSSLSLDDAVTALFTGFVRGLLDTDNDHRFRAVQICEQDPERVAAIRRRLLDLFRSPLCRDLEITFDERRLEPEPIAPTPTERSGSASSRPSPVYLLVRGEQVQADRLRLSTSVLTAGRKAAVLSGQTEVLLTDIAQRLTTLPPKSPAALRAAASEWSHLLLPPDVRAALADCADRPVVVVHDAEGSRFPWEMILNEPRPPALETGVSRRFLTERLSVAKWRAERQQARNLNVLLVVNPTEDLPGAVREAAKVRDVLRELPSVQLTWIEGPEATRRRILEALSSGRHDLVHYAGHAYFDPVNPGRCGLVCAGQEILTGADLAGTNNLPSLFFYNACESARVRSRQPDLDPIEADPHQTRALAALSVAEALLVGGAANYLGTFWPVGDQAAADFASVFYREIARGTALGPALVEARRRLHKASSNDWADYLHYGDPEFRLKIGK